MQFSQNQVQQLYVVNKLTDTKLGDSPVKGEAAFHGEGTKEGYVEYKGAKGTYRTDIVKGSQILSIKVTSGKANSQIRNLKIWEVAPSDNALAAIGQVCILRMSFRNWIGMSDFDTYTKDVAVKVVKGTETANAKKLFCDNLAKAIRQSFAREYDKVITATSDGTKVTIKEVGTDLDEWQRGVKSVSPINLTLSADTITVADGVEETWLDSNYKDDNGSNEFGAKVVLSGTKGTAIGNAKSIADLEYFCAGNRGDMYRNIGWPNVIPTEYLITDTENDTAYDLVNVHYYFVGDGVQSAKSEKDMTFVFKHTAAVDGKGSNDAEKLANKFKALTGFAGTISVVRDGAAADSAADK